MKAFDIEAAKRGDPLICMPAGERGDSFPVTLVGIDSFSRVWSEDLSRHVACHLQSQLRMAPKKRTVYANLWPGRCGTTFSIPAFVAYWYETEPQAREAAHGANGGGSATAIAIPIEIEE